MTRPRPAGRLAIVAFYAALTAAVTWPQVRVLDRAIPNQVDAYFNIWRLAWIAHQLPRDPVHLFDANIFYPERHTLAYSDALLAPGLAAAPLFWLHVNPVLIYNVVFLGGLALSGLATFLLVRVLTADTIASLVAGALFVCAPYRFDHYVHLELQLTMFMPLTLWAMHQSIHSRRWSWAFVVALGLALQVLCSIYYGIYFATLFPVVAALAVLAHATGGRARALGRLAAAAVIGALLALPYMIPYLAVRPTVGVRDAGEVLYYSATPQDYVAAREDHALYGGRLGHGGEERHLFPGVTPLVLAAAAVWPPATPTVMVYVVGTALAFEASLGLHGYLFPWMRASLLPYKGLRVPARFGMLVALLLAILAGCGFARATARMSRQARWALATLVVVVMIFEAGRTPPLTDQPTRATLPDKWLHDQRASVIIELPLPPPGQPFQESEGQPVYHSIFHWQNILNGTSGFFPPTYLQLLDRMASFPDDASLRYLRERNVRYIVARHSMFDAERLAALRGALAGRREVAAIWGFPGPEGESLVFELAR